MAGLKSGTSYDSVRLSGDRIECTTRYARGILTIVAPFGSKGAQLEGKVTACERHFDCCVQTPESLDGRLEERVELIGPREVRGMRQFANLSVPAAR
jgi:hypothetical protein